MVITGISGLSMGDGAGGTIALSVETAIKRYLSTSSISFLTATAKNMTEIKSGSASFYLPQILAAHNYDAGSKASETTETGLITIPINIRRSFMWDYETFDSSRLNDSEHIIATVSASMAEGMLQDLNSEFIRRTIAAIPEAQKLPLKKLWDETTTFDTAAMEAARGDINAIQLQIVKFQKMYNKRMMGSDKSQYMVILDGIADFNIRNGFWNVFGGIDYSLADNLSYTKLGNFDYMIDNMFNNKIAAGQSFSKDTALDTTDIVGLILHNEAIAMPINIQQVGTVIDNYNLNIRTICKYQFGYGMIWPTLVTLLTKYVAP